MDLRTALRREVPITLFSGRDFSRRCHVWKQPSFCYGWKRTGKIEGHNTSAATLMPAVTLSVILRHLASVATVATSFARLTITALVLAPLLAIHHSFPFLNLLTCLDATSPV